MSSSGARRVVDASPAAARTTPSPVPAVKSAQARRQKRNVKRKAARVRKQERKQDASSRQNGQTKGSSQQQQQQLEDKDDEEEQLEEEDSCRRVAAARAIQAAFRLRRLASRLRERQQRAQPLRFIPAAHSKAQGRTAENGMELRHPGVIKTMGSKADGEGAKVGNTVPAEANLSPKVGKTTAPVPNAVAACEKRGRVATAAATARVKLTADTPARTTAARFDTMAPPSKGNGGEEASSAVAPPTPKNTTAASPNTAPATGPVQSRKQKKNAKRKAARVRKRERELGGLTRLVEEGPCSAPRQRLQQHSQNAHRATSVCVREGERRGQAARIIANACKLFFCTKAASTSTGGTLAPGAEVEIAEEGSGRPAAADTSVAAGRAGQITCAGEAAPAVPVAGGPGAVGTTSDRQVPKSSSRSRAADALFVGVDDRAGAGEPGRGEGPPRAPVSLEPSQRADTCRTAVARSIEERPPQKTARQRESRRCKKQLRLEARGQEAAAQQDANDTPGHQTFVDSAAETAAPRHERETYSECRAGLGRAQPPAQERTRGITASSRPYAPQGEQRPPAPAVQVVTATCYTYAMARRKAAMVEQQHCGLEESARAVVVGPEARDTRLMEEGNILVTAETVEAEEESAQTAWAKAVLLRTIRRFQNRKADTTASALAAKGEQSITQTAATETSESTAAAEPDQAVGKAAAGEAELQKLENVVLTKVKQPLGDRHPNPAERQAREEAERKAPRPTEVGSTPHRPPSRQHTSAAPDTANTSRVSSRSTSEGIDSDLHSYVSHPLQLVEGKTLLYNPKEFDLWPLMVQLQGWSLELGVAAVWGGGNQREAEAFSAACGFSAAWGPILLKRVATAVYGKVFAGGVSVLPTDHVVYAFGQFWDKAIAPFDAAERFFRLVKVGSGSAGNSGCNGGIRKDELRHFVLSISSRHPDLAYLSGDDRLLYVDTVLVILFYKFSQCGTINLADLRSSDFVCQMNAVGRLEMDLEDSPFFSVSRQETMRSEYLSLRGAGGGGVGLDALRGYRHGGVRAVGAVRASRVIDAGRRPSTPTRSLSSSSSSACSSSSSSSSSIFSVGGYGQRLDYDAWVCFWLCEESLRSGGASCSSRDVRYCFRQLDEAGRGRVGLREIVPFYEDAKWEQISGGRPEGSFPDIGVAFAHFQDSIGVDRAREYITLEDVTKPSNVERAGRFFAFLFLGMDFDSAPAGGGSVGSGSGSGNGNGNGKGLDASVGAWCCPPKGRPSNPPSMLPVPAPAPAFSPVLATPPLTPPPPLLSQSALSPPPPPQRQQQQRQRQQAWGYRY